MEARVEVYGPINTDNTRDLWESHTLSEGSQCLQELNCFEVRGLELFHGSSPYDPLDIIDMKSREVRARVESGQTADFFGLKGTIIRVTHSDRPKYFPK